mmetsp:Transcript_2921/g.8566  ORF Transcript_2921/g.8566 Transcript_2921/m.8566 type:complete len:116 (+) Transcript_2921:423-770(+)
MVQTVVQTVRVADVLWQKLSVRMRNFIEVTCRYSSCDDHTSLDALAARIEKVTGLEFFSDSHIGLAWFLVRANRIVFSKRPQQQFQAIQKPHKGLQGAYPSWHYAPGRSTCENFG